jgi:hypothetical protein
MSIALGNNKPEQLLEVEKLIWRALFTLSEGTTAPEHILGDLFVKIPWQNFPTTSPQDSEWFTIKATPPPQSAELEKGAPSDNSPRQDPALPLSDNNVMDQSLDNQPLPPTPNVPASSLSDNNAMDQTLDNQPLTTTPNVPASPLSDNNAMDQTLDNQPLTTTPNVPQAMEAESPATGIGFGAMNEDSPSDDPISGAGDGEEADSIEQSLEAPTSRRSARLAMERSKEVSSPDAENSSGGGEEVDIGFGAMNEDSPSDDPISGAGDGEEADSIEQSVEAPTSRRSARLALERSKEVSSPDAESSSRSTSPDEPFLPKSSQATTAVKRKAPTGEPGGSRASPIDVDALHAVLERYPLRREPQVCGRRTLNRNFADKLSSS